MNAKKQHIAIVALAIGFLAYTCICLLIFDKGVVFWVELGFTFVAFLLSAYTTQRPGSPKFFLNLSLYVIASIYLSIQLISSIVFMVMQTVCEPWCYVVSIALLALYLCTLLATHTTVQHIGEIDKSIQQNTSFIKILIMKLETLRDMADASYKKEFDSLIDLARYSNLQSCEASQEIEDSINESLRMLDSAVQDDDQDAVSTAVHQLSKQLKQRDQICKASHKEQ